MPARVDTISKANAAPRPDYDRDLALLDADTGYQSDSAARYASEMLALAQGSDTPWGWEHSAEAAAAAEYASSMAAAALTDGTATIDESYTFAQTVADETRTLSVNEATAAFNSATALAAAEYNHVTSHATALANDNYDIAERVPTAVITLVGLDDLDGRAAGDPADFIAALNKNGGSPFSDLGDSFYTAAVDKMFYTPPETDELGYSNSFDRWLGENLIRPAVGDDNLINATDAQLFWGTAAFAAISAVSIVYAAPVLATAVVDMGIKGVVFTLAKDFIIGGAISGIIDAGVQLEHMYENGGDFNWSRLGESIVVGGVMGMGMGTAFRGVQTLSKALTTRYAAACVPVTIGQKLGLGYLGSKGIAHGVEAIGNGETVEGVSSILFGALGVAGALSMRWNCFTAGHQILALPLGVTVAEASASMSDETRGWRTEYFIGASVAIAVGMTGWVRERRKRRRLLAQARDHVYGSQWESNSRHDLDDDAYPDLMPEAIAMDDAEATIWADESYLPDADYFDERAALLQALNKLAA